MKKYVLKMAAALFSSMLLAVCFAAEVRADEVLQFTKNLVLGQTVNDSLSTGNGRYDFTIQRSGTLTVQMGVYEGSGYSWGYHGGATLYEDNGREIKKLRVSDNTSGTDTGVFTADILAGNYYIIIDRAHGDLNYYLSTDYIDSKETVVDSLTDTHNSQANPISLPLKKTYTGHIADNSADDVYKVKSSKSQYITFKVANRTNGCVFKIINTNNTVNRTENISANSQSVKVFCPKGTYYVTISKYSDWTDNPHTGTYTIRADASGIPTSNIKKVTNKSGKIMAVTFVLRNAETVNGYQIQYATNNKFTKGRKSVFVTNSNYLKSTYEILVGSKKTCYVRIRTYVEDNRGNRYYSAWSSQKKISIRK